MSLVRRFVLIAVISPWVFWTTSAQEVPSAVGDCANSPMAMIACLAEVGIPAGLEIHLQDLQRAPGRASLTKLPVRPTRPAQEIVDLFNGRSSFYKATLENGVLAIRPTAVERRSAFLSAKSPISALHARGVLAAMRRLFAPLDPRLDYGPGAVIASITHGPPDDSDSVLIDVATTNHTTIDVLGEIARVARHFPWLVVTGDDEENKILNIGYCRADGVCTEQTLQSRR